jgi:hypothetical protein
VFINPKIVPFELLDVICNGILLLPPLNVAAPVEAIFKCPVPVALANKTNSVLVLSHQIAAFWVALFCKFICVNLSAELSSIN